MIPFFFSFLLLAGIESVPFFFIVLRNHCKVRSRRLIDKEDSQDEEELESKRKGMAITSG